MPFIRLECQAGIDEEEVTDLEFDARTPRFAICCSSITSPQSRLLPPH